MLTVHHLENSRSQRVLWLLEELGLPYEVRRYARDPSTKLAPPELLRVHPLGKSPVLGDGDITVAESGAIIEYLLDEHGDGRLRPPPGSAERRRFTYWLHFAEGSAMPYLVMTLVFNQLRRAPMPFFARPIARGIADKVSARFLAPNITRQLDFIETELATQPWFAGNDFSAADIQMSFPLEAATARAKDGVPRPHVADWLARIHERPAYRQALAKGGPFSVLD